MADRSDGVAFDSQVLNKRGVAAAVIDGAISDDEIVFCRHRAHRYGGDARHTNHLLHHNHNRKPQTHGPELAAAAPEEKVYLFSSTDRDILSRISHFGRW